MTTYQREEISDIIRLMRDEVVLQAKRPIALQEAANALQNGLTDGSLTPEKAREIICHYEAEFLAVPTYEGEEVRFFGPLIQSVINNPNG